jgi:DNA-binding transcriptional ArsR family regulator
MQHSRINLNSARQLRLSLPETQSVWPDEIWDELPDTVRREVLRQLAEVLSRWLASLEPAHDQ